MNNEVYTIKNFSAEDENAKIIVDNLTKVVKYAMVHDAEYGRIADLSFAAEKIEDYNELSQKSKLALLAFAAEKAGIKKIETKGDVVTAFDNPNFVSIFNSIMRETLEGIVLTARPEQIFRLANVVNVGLGDSETFEIDPKGLPVAQRTSYTANVVFLDSYAKSSITVKPQPYAAGMTLDYIRILANDYDIGREIARIAAALLFAQLKLIVESIFSIADLNNTPFYQATWNAEKYVQMAEDIKMLNGGSAVTAYGTLPAFNKIGALATANYGFQVQDEMIRNGYIGRAYGIDNVVLEQFTDLSKAFTSANATSMRTIPNDRILLLSSVMDKPVKLVREDYIRVITEQPNDGSQYRSSYKYFMSFDAAVVTQANYGIQSTAN